MFRFAYRAMSSSTSTSTSASMTSTSTTSQTPVADTMRKKLVQGLAPSHLTIADESAKHAGHAAMKGLRPQETHFRITIVSDAFLNKPHIARHRLCNSLLQHELDNGVHALSLKTKTPKEYQKKQKKSDDDKS